ASCAARSRLFWGSDMESDIKTVTYKFRLENGVEKEFSVKLSSPGLRQTIDVRAEAPEWTKLEFHQCPNCPLKPADSPRCPVAVSLVDLIDLFKDILSTEVVDVVIEVPERSYTKRISVQDGLSALMGIYMASSGCPILDQMRPM